MTHNKVVKSIKGPATRASHGHGFNLKKPHVERMHSGRGHHLSHANQQTGDNFMPGSYRLAGPRPWGHGKQPKKGD
jgi:hypothetical protein